MNEAPNDGMGEIEHPLIDLLVCELNSSGKF